MLNDLGTPKQNESEIQDIADENWSIRPFVGNIECASDLEISGIFPDYVVNRHLNNHFCDSHFGIAFQGVFRLTRLSSEDYFPRIRTSDKVL